jgi:hypothetical protein
MKSLNSRLLIATTATALALSACTGGKQQQQPASSDDTVDGPINTIIRDSTLYGLCGVNSAMNTLQLIIDSGDTLNVSIEKAQSQGQVLGGLGPGDRMAVLPLNGHRDTARVVINLSTLMGEWVMPNPLDGAAEMGINIKDGGIVEGIEQSSVIYKTWRIFNGKLEMVSQREGGGDDEETILYDVLMLGPDTLIIRDSEDTFNYGRIREEQRHRTIHFEDAEAEEFKI